MKQNWVIVPLTKRRETQLEPFVKTITKQNTKIVREKGRAEL